MTVMQLALFLPAALLVAASPGANNLLSFVHGVRAGFAKTAVSLSGRFLAFALMILVVAVGLGEVLEASELAFSVIKWLGIAYLVFLGVGLFRAKTLDLDMGSVAGTALLLTKREFTVALMNPKAALLFTAFLPQFVTATGSFAEQLLLLGALYIGIEFLAACGYAYVGVQIRRFEMTPRRAVTVNRTTGGIMLGAAAMLATMNRA